MMLDTNFIDCKWILVTIFGKVEFGPGERMQITFVHMFLLRPVKEGEGLLLQVRPWTRLTLERQMVGRIA